MSKKLTREMLKKEWKKFKRENREYKNMTLPQFKLLWKASILETQSPTVHQEVESSVDVEDFLADIEEVEVLGSDEA